MSLMLKEEQNSRISRVKRVTGTQNHTKTRKTYFSGVNTIFHFYYAHYFGIIY